jgi:hypothetical protein
MPREDLTWNLQASKVWEVPSTSTWASGVIPRSKPGGRPQGFIPTEYLAGSSPVLYRVRPLPGVGSRGAYSAFDYFLPP